MLKKVHYIPLKYKTTIWMKDLKWLATIYDGKLSKHNDSDVQEAFRPISGFFNCLVSIGQWSFCGVGLHGQSYIFYNKRPIPY